MTTFRQQDQETYGRMEFMAYYFLALTLLGASAFIYLLYHCLSA